MNPQSTCGNDCSILKMYNGTAWTELPVSKLCSSVEMWSPLVCPIFPDRRPICFRCCLRISWHGGKPPTVDFPYSQFLIFGWSEKLELDPVFPMKADWWSLVHWSRSSRYLITEILVILRYIGSYPLKIPISRRPVPRILSHNQIASVILDRMRNLSTN